MHQASSITKYAFKLAISALHGVEARRAMLPSARGDFERCRAPGGCRARPSNDFERKARPLQHFRRRSRKNRYSKFPKFPTPIRAENSVCDIYTHIKYITGNVLAKSSRHFGYDFFVVGGQRICENGHANIKLPVQVPKFTSADCT